jgi:arylsulfatase A-like enzyme
MISSLSEASGVSNILIFISDSLRFDHLPERIKSRSTWGRAIAASTFTGSGYPSILTGKYPSNHRVWALTETLAEKPQILQVAPHFGIDATTVWGPVSEPANKPPIRMCLETENTTLSEIETPFVLVVHDTGGHMQYGRRKRDDWDSHENFFDELCGQPDRIKQLYQEGVEKSVDRFFELCRGLKSRGQFENTLIVLTSDHGELLGEYGGLYDHGAPIVPELVSVPMAFLGAELPTDEQLKPLLSTTDIVPTAFTALDEPLPPSLDGSDLWNGKREKIENRILQSEIWRDPDYPIMSYKANSAWTRDGGVVHHLNSMPSRLAYLLAYEYYYASYANIVRRPSWQTKDHWKAYLNKENVYGDPPHEAFDRIPRDFQTEQQPDNISKGPNKQQLRDLGYLE